MEQVIDEDFALCVGHTVPIAPALRSDAANLMLCVSHTLHTVSLGIRRQRKERLSLTVRRKLLDEFNNLVIRELDSRMCRLINGVHSAAPRWMPAATGKTTIGYLGLLNTHNSSLVNPDQS